MKLNVYNTSLAVTKKSGRQEMAQEIERAGEVFAEGVQINHEILDKILKKHAPEIKLGQRIVPHTVAGAALVIASRAEICAACEWNVDELCQHPGCRTCPGKQARSGKLAAMISTQNAKCPANKWK